VLERRGTPVGVRNLLAVEPTGEEKDKRSDTDEQHASRDEGVQQDVLIDERKPAKDRAVDSREYRNMGRRQDLYEQKRNHGKQLHEKD